MTTDHGLRPQQFRAGAATADITPEFGVSLNGTILKSGPVKSVHDRLHARALVLNDGRTRLPVVVCERTIAASPLSVRVQWAAAKQRWLQDQADPALHCNDLFVDLSGVQILVKVLYHRMAFIRRVDEVATKCLVPTRQVSDSIVVGIIPNFRIDLIL